MSSGSTNFPQSNSPSKRAKHSTRLAERAEKNTEIATRLISTAKQLVKIPDTEDQVEKLIDLTRELLENNDKLIEQVGEAILDIPANG
jgi:bifunctional ADP-heptose synthase (sugar kinase/adenylyltransferase)